MEVLEDNVYTGNSLSVDGDVKGFLLETAKWAKFLSIVGFVMTGLMLVASFFMITLGSSLPTMQDQPPFMGIGIGYIILSVIMFFPVYYLFKSAVGLKKGITTSSQEDFRNGFQHLKSHYKFNGIFTIVLLSIYVLAIVIGLVFAGTMASSIR